MKKTNIRLGTASRRFRSILLVLPLLASLLFIFLISFYHISPAAASLYSGELTEEWNRTYGGRYGDGAWSVQETNDGGYVLVGHTATRGEGSDLWLVRVDPDGNPFGAGLWVDRART